MASFDQRLDPFTEIQRNALQKSDFLVRSILQLEEISRRRFKGKLKRPKFIRMDCGEIHIYCINLLAIFQIFLTFVQIAEQTSRDHQETDREFENSSNKRGCLFVMHQFVGHIRKKRNLPDVARSGLVKPGKTDRAKWRCQWRLSRTGEPNCVRHWASHQGSTQLGQTKLALQDEPAVEAEERKIATGKANQIVSAVKS
jgi:hypothetical protein